MELKSDREQGWEKQFDEHYGNLFDGDESIYEDVITFIRTVEQEAYERGKGRGYMEFISDDAENAEKIRSVERIRIESVIKEHGQQQDDDTIWCDMDVLLEAIKGKQV